MKKQTSEQKILNALKEKGPMTQAELLRVTKVKGVYQLVAKMVKENKVKKDGKQILLWDPGLKWPEDGKKVSQAIHNTPILDHFKNERDRLMGEIENRLSEYAYVLGQITKLTNEA
jgi:hypothetical protein